MSTSAKILIGLLVIFIVFNLFKESILGVKKADVFATKQIVQERMNIMKNDTFVDVYFLGLNKDKTPIFQSVKRVVEDDETPLRVAIEDLLDGPTISEKQTGIYSEIPEGTKLIALTETPQGIIVDLSSTFETGGGADSTYSRVKQIIRTINSNSKGKNIYLYINGKQADVIGTEGIMITQPLNEASLDG